MKASHILTELGIDPARDHPHDDEGNWLTTCPAHDDGRPSLIVRFATGAGKRTDWGTYLDAYGRAGCECHAIVKAAGLAVKDTRNVELDLDVTAEPAKPRERVSQATLDAAAQAAAQRAAALAAIDEEIPELAKRGFDHRGREASELYAYGVGWEDDKGIVYTTFDAAGQVAFSQWKVGSEWHSDRNVDRRHWLKAGFMGPRRDGPVVICEGPGDALAVAEIGIVAVAVRGAGAAKGAAKEIAEFVRGRVVLFAGDNDQSGRDFNDALAAELHQLAHSMHNVKWDEDAPEKFDLADLRVQDPDRFGRILSELLDLDADAAAEVSKPERREPPAPGEWEDSRLRGHMRIGARLAQYAEGRLVYVAGVGWHAWDGKRWVPDTDEVRTRRVLKEMLRYCWPEAMDDEKLAADIRAAMNANGTRGVLDSAAVEPRLYTAEIDADPWLLNVQNGTLDLRTLELKPHDPADMITKITPTAYDPAAENKDWTYLLESSLPNVDVREFLQRFLGMSLIGTPREHVMGVLKGDGRNGKGVIVRSLTAALGRSDRGGYTTDSVNDVVLEGKYKDSGKRSAQDNDALMGLRGVRVAFLTELSDNTEMDEALTKSLTGGDPITAKLMRQSFQTFEPSHTFLMQSNELPRVKADSQAVWDRLRVIPFNVSFRDNPDIGLEDRIKANPEAVLAWLVAGLHQYHKRGLDAPAEVIIATQEYRDDSDTLGKFIESECVTGADMWVAKTDLRAASLKWAEAEGEELPPARTFNTQMRARGYREANRGPRRARVKAWTGIGLKVDPSDDGPISGDERKTTIFG